MSRRPRFRQLAGSSRSRRPIPVIFVPFYIHTASNFKRTQGDLAHYPITQYPTHRSERQRHISPRSPRKPVPAARRVLAPFRSGLSPLPTSLPGKLQVKTDAAGRLDKGDPLGANSAQQSLLPFALWLPSP
ncbi:uncharacterized protein B0H64DRAFT_113436 [Chaetomium fimeti]|uniref:Uncharacterized protein n=1 Tax=Chaetomium fimeti TaxID=1854472 RepID=A0AAE0HHY8_9PEZI|nr:hypothetical protein B0H64DRAFT_113436 [Chaetomium fimeti]